MVLANRNRVNLIGVPASQFILALTKKHLIRCASNRAAALEPGSLLLISVDPGQVEYYLLDDPSPEQTPTLEKLFCLTEGLRRRLDQAKCENRMVVGCLDTRRPHATDVSEVTVGCSQLARLTRAV